MTLQEFLLTADADHAIALQQARDYQPEPRLWRIEGPVRKTQVETGLIIHGTRERLDLLIANTSNPVPVIDLAKKVKRAIDALYEPEFYINLGDPEVAAMIAAAETYGVLNTDEIARIRAAGTYQDPKPFATVTLHQVLLVRGVCPNKPVVNTQGYAVVTTTANCEQHNPRLLAKNPRTLQLIPVCAFPAFFLASTYEVKIPEQCIAWELFVEDAYGVIG